MLDFVSTVVIPMRSKSAPGKGDGFISSRIQPWKIPKDDGGFNSSDTVSFMSTSENFPNGKFTYRNIMQNSGSRSKIGTMGNIYTGLKMDKYEG